jgi:Cu/Ag efflux pump CusA
VTVTVDLAAAERFGLKPGDVRRAAAAFVTGEEVGDIFRDGKAYDVVAWSTPESRNSLPAIQQLPLDTPSGQKIQLQDVAEVAMRPVPNNIHREDQARVIEFGTNVEGRSLSAVAGDIEDALEDFELPLGFSTKVEGEYKERQESDRRLFLWGIVAAIGIFMLLVSSFKSGRLALLSFLTLPMALVGGVIAAWWFGDSIISLGSLVGFFTILGIVARNGIMQISHFKHLEEQEGETFGPDLVVRGARERLAPIMMTALTTGLALVPLIIAGEIPGHEIEYPMAIIIVGGLIFSTLVNLFVVPSLYLRFGKSKRERDAIEAAAG